MNLKLQLKVLIFNLKWGGINHVFDSPDLRGYSGLFTPEVIIFLRRSKDVAVIELDSVVHAIEFKTQKSASWGLSRMYF